MNHLKLKLIILLAALMAVLPLSGVSAEGIQVELDGELQKLQFAPFLAYGGTTMVSLDDLSSMIGCTYTWDVKDKQLTVKKDADVIKINIGKSEISYNGVQIPIGAPIKIVDGKVIVPVAVLCRLMHYDVSWDGSTSTVKIKMPIDYSQPFTLIYWEFFPNQPEQKHVFISINDIGYYHKSVGYLGATMEQEEKLLQSYQRPHVLEKLLKEYKFMNMPNDITGETTQAHEEGYIELNIGGISHRVGGAKAHENKIFNEISSYLSRI